MNPIELSVLNTKFEEVGIIDTPISLIWTDRFDQSGDFELCLPMDNSFLEFLKKDYYLVTDESDRVMIVEDIDITTDAEDGPQLIITGRSLEQIIDRRIVLNKTSFEAEYDDEGNKTEPNLQNGLKKLFDENLISPEIAARRIPNFIFKESTDEKITKLTFEAQYYGEDLYEIVTKQCQENEIGFRITLDENYQFIFELIAGIDRSYDQFDNTYVVFSRDNDNLFNSSYYTSKKEYKNMAIVVGEVEKEAEYDADGNLIVPELRTVIMFGQTINESGGIETYSGLERREIFEDASNISHTPDELTELTDEQYKAHLKQRAIDTLIEKLEVEIFEGEIEATIMYKYGEDFFIGDIVQLEDEYGNDGKARVSEFIISQDSSGISMYPTFTTIQEGEYDYE